MKSYFAEFLAPSGLCSAGAEAQFLRLGYRI